MQTRDVFVEVHVVFVLYSADLADLRVTKKVQNLDAVAQTQGLVVARGCLVVDFDDLLVHYLMERIQMFAVAALVVLQAVARQDAVGKMAMYLR